MKSENVTFKKQIQAYIVGFTLCLVVTVVSYILVVYGGVSTLSTIILLILLAGVQVALQSYFFLHIGREEKPRWQSISYAFIAMTVAIVVLGSLWIMSSLNYNMMHDMTRSEHDIINDERVHETTNHSH